MPNYIIRHKCAQLANRCTGESNLLISYRFSQLDKQDQEAQFANKTNWLTMPRFSLLDVLNYIIRVRCSQLPKQDKICPISLSDPSHQINYEALEYTIN